MESETVSYNLAQIHRRIEAACKQSGRLAEEVRLLLATKTVAAEKILVALAAGATLIGENKAQEAGRKFDLLREAAAEWHFIGHLQT